jgi:hypothetical protein
MDGAAAGKAAAFAASPNSAAKLASAGAVWTSGFSITSMRWLCTA